MGFFAPENAPPGPPWRLLICGDRNWTNASIIRQVLCQIGISNIEVVIEGEARGADTMGRQAAEAFGIPVLAFPADWKKYGKAAGPIRNSQMIKEGHPNKCVAFHNDIASSKGTADMVRQCRANGIPVTIIGHTRG